MINSRVIVVLINGLAESGKDTFIEEFEMVRQEYQIHNISTIDPFKKLLADLHDYYIKSDKQRQLLSDLKMVVQQSNPQLILDYIKYKISESINNSTKDNHVVFIHSREPDEIAALHLHLLSVFDLSTVYTLFIDSGEKVKYLNFSDMHVNDYQYDLTLFNPKCADDESKYLQLSKLVQLFIQHIGLSND